MSTNPLQQSCSKDCTLFSLLQWSIQKNVLTEVAMHGGQAEEPNAGEVLA